MPAARHSARPRPLRAALLLALSLIQVRCGAGWHRIAPPAPAVLPPRQQVEVWQAGRALRLHAVRLTTDSLSGVPYLQPPDCDSCRVRLPRGPIDSLRTGNPTAGFWKAVGLTLGGALVVGVIACASSRSCQIVPD
jgi:hypothetical protein